MLFRFLSFLSLRYFFFSFFFNHTATTEIYTLSLTTLFRSNTSARIPLLEAACPDLRFQPSFHSRGQKMSEEFRTRRSEEHTSELQSPDHLVCRLLLEKKKTKHN